MYPPLLNNNLGHNTGDGFVETGTFTKLNSSCSDEGTRYQSGQNVISTCLWLDPQAKFGTIRNYQLGVLRNLEMMRIHYPGYSFRLYTNLQLNAGDFFCDALCKHQDLFWCDIRHTPSHGDLSNMVFMTWRFLPLGDPTVESFHSRDLDSLISSREAAAVEDWFSKGDQKAIMLMRDSDVSHDLPILGGMWGAHNIKLGFSVGREIREKIIKRSNKVTEQAKSKGWDQFILNEFMFYPLLAKDLIVAYDAYSCVKWSNFTEVRPFPSRRLDRNFVGRKAAAASVLIVTYESPKCPVECRPDFGKDWDDC